MLFNTRRRQRGEWGLAAIPGRSAEARRDIELALEYACQLGRPQAYHGRRGAAGSGSQTARPCLSIICATPRRFARHDKRILIEALNPQTKPGYLYHSQYQTLAMAETGRQAESVQLDLFHAQKVDGNLQAILCRTCRPVSPYSDCPCPTVMNR